MEGKEEKGASSEDQHVIPDSHLFIRGIRQKLDPEVENIKRINATSTSKEDLWKQLSPFFLGPVELYDGHVAKNAWQFCKVFPKFTDSQGEPTAEYLEWAKKGWASEKAHRFPMGKGAKPKYSLFNGEKLRYIEARFRIYAPLYAQLVEKTEAFQELKKLAAKEPICIMDFDGWDYKKLGLTLEDVIYYSEKKMGHGFVLLMLLKNQKVWETMPSHDLLQRRIAQVNQKAEEAKKTAKKRKPTKKDSNPKTKLQKLKMKK